MRLLGYILTITFILLGPISFSRAETPNSPKNITGIHVESSNQKLMDGSETVKKRVHLNPSPNRGFTYEASTSVSADGSESKSRKIKINPDAKTVIAGATVVSQLPVSDPTPMILSCLAIAAVGLLIAFSSSYLRSKNKSAADSKPLNTQKKKGKKQRSMYVDPIPQPKTKKKFKIVPEKQRHREPEGHL